MAYNYPETLLDMIIPKFTGMHPVDVELLFSCQFPMGNSPCAASRQQSLLKIFRFFWLARLDGHPPWTLGGECAVQ